MVDHAVEVEAVAVAAVAVAAVAVAAVVVVIEGIVVAEGVVVVVEGIVVVAEIVAAAADTEVVDAEKVEIEGKAEVCREGRPMAAWSDEEMTREEGIPVQTGSCRSPPPELHSAIWISVATWRPISSCVFLFLASSSSSLSTDTISSTFLFPLSPVGSCCGWED